MNNMASLLKGLFRSRSITPDSPVSPESTASSVSRSSTPLADPAYGLATLLVDKSKVVKLYPQYRDDLIHAVFEEIPNARSKPGAHTDSELIQLAKHTCTIDWIQKAIEILHAKIETVISQLPPDDARDFIKTQLSGIAVVLAQGFDKVEEKKFIRDSSGKIIGITDPRQSECDKALKSGETLGGRRKRKQTKKKLQKKHKTSRRSRH